MKLTAEEAREIVWGDHEDWREVESTIIDQTRWEVIREGVFKHIPTDKHYSVCWGIGATEQQDTGPFEYEKEVEFEEVVQKEVVVKQWVGV